MSATKSKPVFYTKYGALYHGDCIEVMRGLEKESVNLVFADPPFNLNKTYESGYDDNVSKGAYVEWMHQWLSECTRVIKQGGALFVWNLPKWNTYAAAFLNNHLTFRHWIAVDIKYRLPIAGRLYPSHYSLVYFIKGKKSAVFNNQRIPMQTCPKCGQEYHDYGGYKDKMNPKGVNLADVWYDIPPVRHRKYKNRNSNELSLKLLERVISLASNEGDLVLDPFGGSGTTYVAAEMMKRKWLGIEIGACDIIANRFKNLEHERELISKYQSEKNVLFTENTRRLRLLHKRWLPETLRKKRSKESNQPEIALY